MGGWSRARRTNRQRLERAMNKTNGTTMILLMAIMLSMTVLVGSFAVTVNYKNQIAMKYINRIKARYLAYSVARGHAAVLYRNIPKGSSTASPEKLSTLKFNNISDNDTTESTREISGSNVRITAKTNIYAAEKKVALEYYAEQGIINAYGLEYGMFPESKLPVIKIEQ